MTYPAYVTPEIERIARLAVQAYFHNTQSTCPCAVEASRAVKVNDTTVIPVTIDMGICQYDACVVVNETAKVIMQDKASVLRSL